MARSQAGVRSGIGLAEGVLRGVVAAAVLLSADIHLVLYVEGYSDIPVIGPMFAVNVVAGLAIGVGVLVWRHWLAAFLAAGFGAATFVAYLLSRTVGLFGVREMSWDAQGVLAAVAEVLAVVGGVVLLIAARLRSTSDS
ncbi:MAG: hypothetical protein GEV07_16390 [Streptosporangiales bacterium]|nr:hypothetical protein [Streptosporangiales bacterium]